MKQNLFACGAHATLGLIVYWFVLSPVAALAATGINPQIPFYGTLNDQNGDPVTAAVDVVFKIYDAPSGGTVLWTGNYTGANGNPVSVSNGAMSVMLGSGTGNALALDFNDDSYYLGVTIGTDTEMTPRERLGATGYAFNTDRLDGLDATDFVQNGSALNVTSTSTSIFEGAIQTGDAFGILFGSESGGIHLFQNPADLGPSDLFFAQRNNAHGSNIYLNGAGGLTLTANANADGSGLYTPSIDLNESGKVTIANYGLGDPEDQMLELFFGNGVYISSGNLRLGSGSYFGATEADPDTELNIEGTIKSSSLSSAGVTSLSADANGNIMLGASDERLKTNIQDIIDPLDTVLRMRGVTYEWKDTERFGTGREVGFIAQELQPVLPEVVRDGGAYLSVNTQNIVAVVIEAIKELYVRVEEYFARTETLEREVAELKAEVASLKGENAHTREEETVTNEIITDEVIVNPPEATEAPISIPEPTPEPVEEVVPETSVSES